MAAGSLFGVIVTPLLVGSAAEAEATPASLPTPAAAAAFNCSVNASDIHCTTGLTNRSSLRDITTRRVTTTWATTTPVANDFVNQVLISSHRRTRWQIPVCSLHENLIYLKLTMN